MNSEELGMRSNACTENLRPVVCALASRRSSITEKQRRSKYLEKLEQNNQSHFKRFSVSQHYMRGRGLSGIRTRKVKLEDRRSECSLNSKPTTRNEDVEPGRPASVKERLDGCSYRKWLISEMKKSKATNMLGKRVQVSQEVADSCCLSCSKKRQRVDYDSEQQYCSCNEKHGCYLQDISVPEDGRQSMSRISMELIDEETGDVWGEESNLGRKADEHINVCDVCMLGGELLYCDGKGCHKSYHLSCLDPPFVNAPPGFWHCIWCDKKKLELGVYSVSKGVESIWDVREVFSNCEEMHQKEYLVKFKGLAHVHNRWIPEVKMVVEAPNFLAKFKRKIQLISWRKEWTVPQRLLQKRLLSFAGQHGDFCQEHDDCNSCCYEWLVKWTGLGYDHATWELDSSPFLTSPQAKKLIRDYETRHSRAEILSGVSQAKQSADTVKEPEAIFFGISALLFGLCEGEHCPFVSYVKKLHESWHKSRNGIVIDNKIAQERVVKIILFILSLQHVLLRPVLIISAPDVLSVWEAEFLHIGPSSNFIVYKGNKDLRCSVRSLEFYNEGGQIMFEVLLSSSRIIVEDLEMLKCIAWSIIVIDECQCSYVLSHTEHLKMLTADVKLLLASDQIKDSSMDYLNVLSLLNHKPNLTTNGKTDKDSTPDICKLKEELSTFIIYECKLDSKFVEYWVPVHLSNVQLEQYCAVLLSNIAFLRSCSKNDPADALREIIVATRKCCDHPYLGDPSLQNIVRNGLSEHDCFDAEVKVSGKLLLLEKILAEMRGRGLRALIIFQSFGGSGRDSVGDILEDFVRQRFGGGCYVRIDGMGGTYARSKKRAALDMFNDKESGKFLFLIEKRSCLSSIRLFSVDSVILFDSDWDPQSDLRALHKITITPQFEQLKVFRLYSCYTVEEKLLILAKEGSPLDNTFESINRNIFHALLNWGASHLFTKLDEFHSCEISASSPNVFSEWLFVDDVLRELTAELPCNTSLACPSKHFISEIQQNEGPYGQDAFLHGEKETFRSEAEPVVWWTKLQERRHPRWRFVSGSSSRIRRKIQDVDILQNDLNVSTKARTMQQVVNNRVNWELTKSRTKNKAKSIVVEEDPKVTARMCEFPQCSTAGHPVVNNSSRVLDANIIESEDQITLSSAEKKTLFSLMLDIMSLCGVLKLPEKVRDVAMAFLLYIEKVYDVSWETVSTSQAFQISLCWTAACLLKHEIDHEESLGSAKVLLEFDCEYKEANYIYSKLQDVKKEFLAADNMKSEENIKDPNDVEGSSSSTLRNAGVLSTTFSHQNGAKSSFVDSPIRLHIQTSMEELVQLQDGEISNQAKDSKSTSFVDSSRQTPSDKTMYQHVEEEVMPADFQREVVSDRMVEQELEEGEIPIGSQRDVPQDLEEGEIPTDSQGEILSYNGMEHCLEEGEIPSDSQGNILSNKRVAEHLEVGEIRSDCQDQDIFHERMVENLGEELMPIDSQKKILSEEREGQDLGQGENIMDSAERILSGKMECQDLEEGEMSIVCQRQILPYKGVELELTLKKKGVELESVGVQKTMQSGNIMDTLVSANVDETTASAMLDTESKEEMDGSYYQVEIQGELLKTAKPKSSTGDNTVCQMDKRFTSLSVSEINVDKLQPGDTSVIHASSGNAILETLPSSTKRNQCGKVPKWLPETSKHSWNEKNICGLPVGSVRIVIDSDSETEEIETVLRNVSATCELQNDTNGSPNSCKDWFPKLDCQERQNLLRNVETVEQVERHSGAGETQRPELIVIDDATESSTQPIPSLMESTASERAAFSKQAVPSMSMNSCGSPTTRISSPLVHQDSDSVQLLQSTFPDQFEDTDFQIYDVQLSHCSILKAKLPFPNMFYQLPLPTNASSAGQSLPIALSSAETPYHLSSGSLASGQDAQVRNGLSTEDLLEYNLSVTEFFRPSTLASMQECRNVIPVPDNRSRMHGLDFRSATTNFGSLNVQNPHATPMPPDTPSVSCSDPLQNEIEKMQKEDKQDLKAHEDMVLQIRLARDEAIKEANKNYEILLQHAEAALLQRRKERTAIFHKVYANKLLAEVFKVVLNKSPVHSDLAAEATNLLYQYDQSSVWRTAQATDQAPDHFRATPTVALSLENYSSAILSGVPVRTSNNAMAQFMGHLQNGSEGQGATLQPGSLGLYSNWANVTASYPDASSVRPPASDLGLFGLDSSTSSPQLPNDFTGAENQQAPHGLVTQATMQRWRQLMASHVINWPESGDGFPAWLDHIPNL